jgi:hypothetical protein
VIFASVTISEELIRQKHREDFNAYLSEVYSKEGIYFFFNYMKINSKGLFEIYSFYLIKYV